MLVLRRMIDQAIIIDDDIRVVVLKIKNGSVTLGIDAPKDILVRREELEPENNTGGIQ